VAHWSIFPTCERCYDNGNVVVHSSLLSVVLHDQPQIKIERDDQLRQRADMAGE
jgi:hypothetical protein